MDGVRFQVGDWVRLKPEWQDGVNWTLGETPLRIRKVDGAYCYLETTGTEWNLDRFLPCAAPVEPFDPHALGIALVLSDLLVQEALGSPFTLVGYRQLDVADWLRACVTEELLSQEAE